MLQAIEAYPIYSKNYIFSNKLTEDGKYNTKIHNSVIELNKRMNTRILPIVLKYELYILQKHMRLKRQRKNRKATNVSSVIKKI